MKKKPLDKKELWLKIKAYQFEHVVPPHLWDNINEMFGGTNASMRAFAHKIAKKLDWNVKFAITAIDEYKKFIYLMLISDFHVTPSLIIDQVWHEHLLFTKAYREFCKEISGRILDHNPSLIETAGEVGTFNAQYNDTLALYTKEFNVEAPEAIWGKPKFDPDKVEKTEYQSRKKRPATEDVSSPSADSADTGSDMLPLFMMFELGQISDRNSYPEFSGFGGGDMGGGGSSGSWSPAGSDSVSPGGADNGCPVDTAGTNTDTDCDTASDNDGGSDAGNGDSGGSSCSSSSCSSSSCGSSCGGS